MRSKNVKQCTEEGGRWEGKKSGGTGKGEQEQVNGESIYLDGQHVTEFLTMFAYEYMALYDNVYMHHFHSQLTI